MPSASSVALVTGTGGSVGTEMAAALLNRGFRTIGVYRSARHLQSLQDRFRGQDGIELVQADLSVEADTKRLVDHVRDTLGRLDVVVNAAGGWIGGKRLHEHTAEDFERMLNMDLRACFNLLRAVLPLMQEQRGGKFIQFASATALQVPALNSVYGASKSAVMALCQATAKEYRDDGIQIFILAPTTIDTPKNRQAMPDADFTKWVRLEDIVQTVEFLATGGAALSGTVFRLDYATRF